jgi:hypothetical protein
MKRRDFVSLMAGAAATIIVPERKIFLPPWKPLSLADHPLVTDNPLLTEYGPSFSFWYANPSEAWWAAEYAKLNEYVAAHPGSELIMFPK